MFMLDVLFVLSGTHCSLLYLLYVTIDGGRNCATHHQDPLLHILRHEEEFRQRGECLLYGGTDSSVEGDCTILYL